MAELFKFRCYQCNQLLGGPASRVGSVTKCPKCATELVIPPPLATQDDAVAEPEPEGDGVRLEDLGLNLDRPRTVTPSPSPADAQLFTFLEQTEPNPPIEEEAPVAEGLPEPSFLAQLPDPLDSPLVPRSTRPRRSVATPSGRRDVVLPRTAVVAWALFALVSLGFTFMSGLLVGHFLWK